MHGTGVDEPLVWLEGVTNGNRRYLWQNYQGSVIGYATSGGTLQEVYTYGPYGEPVVAAGATPNATSPSFTGFRFRYTGQTVLSEIQLYYYKARVYDPMMGRFLQTDPIGSKDDLNLYAYVKGDPVNMVDPSGLNRVSACKGMKSGEGVTCDYTKDTSGRNEPNRAANDNTRTAANDNNRTTSSGWLGTIWQGLKSATIAWNVSNSTQQAHASMKRQGAYDDCQRKPGSCIWVARFYGGEAGTMGRSWMPLASVQAIGYDKNAIRSHWGIPNGNTMTHLAIGLVRVQDLQNPSLVQIRRALPYDGYDGGGPEYFIPIHGNVPRVVQVIEERKLP